MAQGQPHVALDLVNEVLAVLEGKPLLGGPNEPQVYLTCWQVLHAFGDPRAASVLKKAYCAIQDMVSNIQDEDLRRSYLENLPARRKIIEAWEQLQSTALPDGEPRPKP
jgi:hypothetical protein